MRYKQNVKGWISIQKLPNGKYQSVAFLHRRVNPVQSKAVNYKTARVIAKRYSKKYL